MRGAAHGVDAAPRVTGRKAYGFLWLINEEGWAVSHPVRGLVGSREEEEPMFGRRWTLICSFCAPLSLVVSAQAQTTQSLPLTLPAATPPAAAAPPAKPPAAAAAPAPKRVAPKPAPPRPAPANPALEERLKRVELALSESGLTKPAAAPPSPEQQQRKKELEEQRGAITKQREALEQAIKSGLDPETARPTLDKLELARAENERAIKELEQPPQASAESLTDRLKRLEQRLEEMVAAAAAEQAALPPPPPASPAPVEPKPVVVAEPEKPLAGHKDKFFLRSADDSFSLGFAGQLQTRLAYSKYDDELARDSELAFLIPRSRLGVAGHAFGPGFTYNLLLDFGRGWASVLDSWAEFEVVQKHLYVRVGQMKKPFSRQHLTSTAALQFTDPASTDRNFGAGYDIGVMLHDRFEKSPEFEWALGIYNGTGTRASFTGGAVTGTAEADDDGNLVVDGTVSQSASFNNVPKRMRPTLVARLGYNTPELKGYSESDLEGGGPRFGVAGSVMREFDFDENDASNLRAEVDTMLKVEGFSTTGGLYLGWLEDLAIHDDNALHYDSVGWHVQLGYVIKKTLEPVVRFDGIMRDGPHNNAMGLLAGANLFFSGHKLKVGAELGPQFEQWVDPDDETEHRTLTHFVARSQAQLAF